MFHTAVILESNMADTGTSS